MPQRNTNLTNVEFLDRMSEINPNIEFISEYKNRKTRIECLCKICFHKWNPMADKLLEGRGCPICAKQKRMQCFPKSHEHFMNDFNKYGNPDVEILGKYINVKTKILCKCKICNYEWETIPSVLLKGHGCKKCSDERNKYILRKSHEQFLIDFEKVGNKNIEIIGKYVNSNTYITCKCKLCGKIYDVSPIKLLAGQGCRDCYIKYTVGENHPLWKFDKDPNERIRQRKYEGYQDFVRKCFERDNYTCQITRQVGGILNVHHIDGYNWCDDKRTDCDNGITLSESIHKEFHTIYGNGNNTKEQFLEFINNLYKEKRITNDGYNLLLKKIKNE